MVFVHMPRAHLAYDQTVCDACPYLARCRADESTGAQLMCEMSDAAAGVADPIFGPPSEAWLSDTHEDLRNGGEEFKWWTEHEEHGNKGGPGRPRKAAA